MLYDGWQRLIRWQLMKDGVKVDSADYTFDRTGNISQSATAAYSAATDRLLQRGSGATADSMTYDRAGNLTRWRTSTGQVWTYGYDALEQLVNVRSNGTLIVRYAYDVLGRRIAKRVYSSASGGTMGLTRFSYHGSQVGFETDSAGTTIGLRYTWGPGVDRLLAVRDAAGNHLYVTRDRLGSVRTLTTAAGVWRLSEAFTPYGTSLVRDTASTGVGIALRYRWTGREYDAETGFYFLRARYYSPSFRRFLSEDPIGTAGGPNLYGYVQGEVLEASDPSGLERQNVGQGPDAPSSFYRSVVWIDGVPVEGAMNWLNSSYGFVTGGAVAGSGDGASLLHDIWADQRSGLRTGNDEWTLAVRDCRAASTACDYMAREIDARGISVYGVVANFSLYKSGVRDGRTVPISPTGSASITIDPSQFRQTTETYAQLGINAPMNIVTVVGHELGHVYGQSELYRLNPKIGWECGETCARHYENIVRGETNAGYRDPYDPR